MCVCLCVTIIYFSVSVWKLLQQESTGGSLVDSLQLEDVVTIKTDGPATGVTPTALTWSPLADGQDGETAIR